MTKIRSIVVATDFSPGSEIAVERAVQLAAEHDTSLHLLHAFDVGAWHSLKGVFDAQRITADPPPDVRMQQRLADSAASLAAQTGLKVEAQYGRGAPETVIDSHVKAHATSVVVVGSRAEPTLLGLGGTASKVLRSPACPVLVVRTVGTRCYDKVLTAVDLREGSLRAATLGLGLFPAAHHHLFFALDPALDRSLWIGGLGKAHIELLHGSMHAQAQRDLQSLARDLTRHAAHPVGAELVDDVPSRAVVARAAAWPADCVVVGHHGEGKGAQRFLGNMAQHVLHYTSRDVLVVP